MATQEPAIAMVATTSPRKPEAAPLRKFGRENPPSWISRLLRREVLTLADADWSGENLIMPLGDAIIAVALMPAPIPWSQLEGPCATAWWWPDAASAMKDHSNHFVVAIISGTIPKVERRVELARIVAAVTCGTDAVGVYWGEGTLVFEPKCFDSQIRTASVNDVPVELFVDVRGELNDDGTSRCFTTGMESLGFREIEIPKSVQKPTQLMEFVIDMARYIVNNRLSIPDGDTVGTTAEVQYVVRYSKSMFPRSSVMQIDVP